MRNSLRCVSQLALGFLATLVILSMPAIAAVPEAPQGVSAKLPGTLLDGAVRVEWQPLAPEPAVYKVQWKSGSEEFAPSRQLLVDGIGRSAFLKGLNDGAAYAVRVIASNDHGDGPASAEVTVTPLFGHARYRRFVEEVVQEYELGHPWLRATWDYLMQSGLDFVSEDLEGKSAEIILECRSHTGDALAGCRAVRWRVDTNKWRDTSTVVHELAHIYTLTNGLGDGTAPLAMALVYFHRVCEAMRSSIRSFCRPHELLADVAAVNTLHGSRPLPLRGIGTVIPSYWLRMMFYADQTPLLDGNVWSSVTGLDKSLWAFLAEEGKAKTLDAARLKATFPEARALVRSALKGEVPRWFVSHYRDANGKPDLEHFWADVRAIPAYFRQIMVNQLASAFGGYCSTEEASRSAFHQGATTNPWRDGGCVPEAPAGLEVSQKNKGLAVSWGKSANYGASPVQGYCLRWRLGSKAYHPSDRACIMDAARRTYAIDKVPDGVTYTVEVRAFNEHGEGDGTTATVVVDDRTPPKLSSVTSEGFTLTLRYTEGLDPSSVPVARSFQLRRLARNPGDAFRYGLSSGLRVVHVAVAVNTVTLHVGMKGQLFNGMDYKGRYTPPTGEYGLGYVVLDDSSAAAIRDMAGNPAPGFRDIVVILPVIDLTSQRLFEQ